MEQERKVRKQESLPETVSTVKDQAISPRNFEEAFDSNHAPCLGIHFDNPNVGAVGKDRLPHTHYTIHRALRDLDAH